METRKANNQATLDVKTGQSTEMRAENIKYDDYANINPETLSLLREKRQKNRSSTSGAVLQTYIPPEYKKKGLHYEWFVDDPIIVKSKVEDGWVVVSDEKLSKLKGCSTTTAVKIPSGISNAHGEAEQLILMAIHKELYEDDLENQKRRIKELSDMIDSGKAIVSDADNSGEVSGLEVKEVKIE